jgi:serine/threonine-protein kinase HipA
MPLGPRIFTFQTLSPESFHGLPGMLADSLPDRFGNALIDAWLATRGRTPESFNPVERLCYIGTRGMGALEFEPALGPPAGAGNPIQIDALVALASDVLSRRLDLSTSFADEKRAEALNDILRVGTSAGGARAKAVIAWNPKTDEVRSGQIDADSEFEYWLIKFDGVSGNRDRELDDPRGYGAVEYAYHRMARAAGIEMADCRLMEENGRRHFMTRRFDRTAAGRKLHLQSFAALTHADMNAAGVHAYEQVFMAMRQLELPMQQMEQFYRRICFNLIARNQDDHVKNIAFLMDRDGRWSLSPAFDVTYSYNPTGDWTATHQMSVNGKRDDFTRDDLRACAKTAALNRGHADSIVEEVNEAVGQWEQFAEEAGVEQSMGERVRRGHRLEIK